MESQWLLLLLLPALTPFILYYCLYELNSRKLGVEKINHRLPPGTTGLPFIGESISYYMKLRKGRQYEFVKERMDKYSSKVFRTSFMGKPVAVLCGPEEQTEIVESKEAGNSLSWEDTRKMKYSWNVVCEVYRLYLSGLSFKEAITDITYEGYTIPKGWKIHLITHGTHRNPEYFKDPEKFDPTRFDGDGPAPYSFVPFAGGPRMCPGNEYARLATLTFVHYVVNRFSWEKMMADESILHFPFAYPAQGLPIRLYPRE